MATNRASLSDTYAAPPAERPRLPRPEADAPRRTAMVVAGVLIALVSLAIGSLALVQVWLAPAGAGDGIAATTPALQSWEALAMIIGGGVGFAAGLAMVGIGIGRWTAPRAPDTDADYTGPGGDPGDMPDPPRVV
jgi:hypothetical protein